SDSFLSSLRIPLIERPNSSLWDHRRGNSRLASPLLHVLQFFFGGIHTFLFLGQLLLVLCVFFFPRTRVAHTFAGVGVESSGAQTIFARLVHLHRMTVMPALEWRFLQH